MKRSISDVLGDSLQQIEEQQERQSLLLESVIQNNNMFQSSIISPSSDDVVQPFPVAWKNFLKSFHNLPNEERRKRLKMAISGYTPNSTDFLELLDLFWAEGLARENGKEQSAHRTQEIMQPETQGTHGPGCVCGSNLPQKEFHMEDIYNQDVFVDTFSILPP